MRCGRDINYLPEPRMEPPDDVRYCARCACTLHPYEKELCGSCKQIDRAEWEEHYVKDNPK